MLPEVTNVSCDPEFEMKENFLAAAKQDKYRMMQHEQAGRRFRSRRQNVESFHRHNGSINVTNVTRIDSYGIKYVTVSIIIVAGLILSVTK